MNPLQTDNRLTEIITLKEDANLRTFFQGKIKKSIRGDNTLEEDKRNSINNITHSHYSAVQMVWEFSLCGRLPQFEFWLSYLLVL